MDGQAVLHDQDIGRPVLIADELRKSYGPRAALDGLSLSLYPGRILGFLGPNGAGKTTAIRILTTILRPDRGHFRVAGFDSEDANEIRRRIGVLPESLGFPRNTTAIDYLTFFGRMYGWDAVRARRRASALLAEVGLSERAASLVTSYSRGMRQRLGIARALVNDPRVVFLDEPTLGLDPRGQQDLLALIRRIARDRDVGVVLCSHALTEIEVVCDDVVILSKGRTVASGPTAEVIGSVADAAHGRNSRRLQVPLTEMDRALELLGRLSVLAEVTPIESRAGWLRFEFAEADGGGADDPLAANSILAELIGAQIPILGFEPQGGRLEEVFLHLTEEAEA